MVFKIRKLGVRSGLIRVKAERKSVIYVDANGFRRKGTHVCASCAVVAARHPVIQRMGTMFSFVRGPCAPIGFGRLLISPGSVHGQLVTLVGGRVGGGRRKGSTCVLTGMGRVASHTLVRGLCRTSTTKIGVRLIMHNGYSLMPNIPNIDRGVRVGKVVSHCLRRSHVFVFTGTKRRECCVNSTS